MQKKFSAAKVLKQALQIGGRECLLYTEGEQLAAEHRSEIMQMRRERNREGALTDLSMTLK